MTAKRKLIVTQNNFPMKEWHVTHMEKTIVKYVAGLPDNASMWEKKQHKRYGNLTTICRQIDYDIKHGVTQQQVITFLEKIQHNPSFSDLRSRSDSLGRMNEVMEHFSPLNKVSKW